MFKILTGGEISKVLRTHLCPLPNLSYYVQHDKQVGKWTFKRFKFEPSVGYFSDGSDHGRGVALLQGDITWMSTTPIEFESHLIPQYSAKGTTVIAGLGLGMITLSLLNKREVTKLIVLESDRDLIEGFESILTGKTLKTWRKAVSTGRLVICECDCKKPLPGNILKLVRKCDYLWVDIWERLFSDEALKDTQYLQNQIQAKRVDYWGCELDLIVGAGQHISRLSFEAFKSAASSTQLPLSALALKGPSLQLYMELSAKAVEIMWKINKQNKSIVNSIC